TAYAATMGSGLFKTADGGNSWQGINSGLPSLDVAAIAVDPSSPSTLYADSHDSKNFQGGVFKSTDGGATWVKMSEGIPDAGPAAFAIDPLDTQTVHAGIGDRVYETTDGGTAWT